ncbi:amidohydrolase family protein [Edaphosphingomonas haloaromaticamans]|uniref:N-substituted formamide deformylase n=1 Tax=Edaphosphingomonas haloaromaticamans TaxID=653954 RepID=A0A1S1HG01_9SPHN|nr:amidohydrolase family protein [Sphingomonas haloaromaticamans]OHT21165.1 N-substituted formamide deformylase precursor [Sphingomonas haloaromaticamans]
MLIRDAELDGVRVDLRLAGGRIAAIAPSLAPAPEEAVMEAGGAAVLPGLHDHHIHLNAAAAALASLRCGPPDIASLDDLAARLRAAPGTGWLRGIGYHDSIGRIDRAWLDDYGPDRPIRIQHRGGRMWVLNSRAMDLLDGGPADGRLVDGDAWLAARLPRNPPDLRPLGDLLASYGVTGVTEVTPRNDARDWARYREAGLRQRLLVMGTRALDGLEGAGALKLHYHDHDLPGLDALAAEIAGAHGAGRPVAAHCVTLAELMLTLAAIEAAGPMRGDRIEHCGVAPPEAIDWIARLGLTVVTQPHFVAERQAAYRAEVAAADRPFLYPLRSLLAAGIRVAAGSDAPFGGIDPWVAMAAAVARPEGLGPQEAVTPERALALFTGRPDDPGGPARRLAVGEPADLCLIDRPWAAARAGLAAVRARATWVGGAVAYSTIASTSPQSCAAAAERRRIDSAR